jgi:hypothetical protein
MSDVFCTKAEGFRARREETRLRRRAFRARRRRGVRTYARNIADKAKKKRAPPACRSAAEIAPQKSGWSYRTSRYRSMNASRRLEPGPDTEVERLAATWCSAPARARDASGSGSTTSTSVSCPGDEGRPEQGRARSGQHSGARESDWFFEESAALARARTAPARQYGEEPRDRPALTAASSARFELAPRDRIYMLARREIERNSGDRQRRLFLMASGKSRLVNRPWRPEARRH